MSGSFVNERLYGLVFAFSAVGLSACNAQVQEDVGVEQDVAVVAAPIVDVPHTAVERQSIGNCWLYSHATWIESMHLSATQAEVDLSQSYWTYWHWFDQISGSLSRREGVAEISTGGTWATANGIVRRYGLVDELDFVAEDTNAEMSMRQYYANARINTSLATGALSTLEARRDRALVRAELDAAWELTPEVVSELDQVFGADVARTFDGYGTRLAVSGESAIVSASTFPVAYISRRTSRWTPESFVPVSTTLTTAMRDWRTAYYSRGDRGLLQRAQRAMHQRQPVIVTWNVDFNAQEKRSTSELRGSFNLQTLLAAEGPGSQGGHMVVLEDYEAVTTEFGLLPAGTTLDPNIPEDQAKLTAALQADTEIKFLRVKNSWGTVRADRSSAPGFPGYHDLYMDYLDTPIAWCPSADRNAPDFTCDGSAVPLRHVILPPGF